MRSGQLATCSVIVVGALALLACGDSESTSETADATTTTGGAGGTGGTTGVSTGGAGGEGGTPLPCDLLEHPSTAGFIVFTPGVGSPPPPVGGAIADGTYSLTAINNYNGSSTSGTQGAKQTLILSDGGTRYASRYTTDSGGNDIASCGDVVVTGTALTLHPTGWPDEAFQMQTTDSEYFGYSVTTGLLTVHWYPGQQTTQSNINTYVAQ
jgi:hypothetical protein